MAASAERHFRAFARRAVALPATVTAKEGDARPVRLVNLGLGGAYIEMGERLAVGAPVTLEVTAPNLWDPLVVPAKVVWLRDIGAGHHHAGLAFGHAEKSGLPALVELLAAYRYE